MTLITLTWRWQWKSQCASWSTRHGKCLLLALLLCWPSGEAGAQTLPETKGRDQVWQVKANETLFSIARSHRLGLEHVAFANRRSVTQEVKPGGRLRVPGRRILPLSAPRDGLVLNLPERGLFLFRKGSFEGFYPVAVGAPGWNTPVGAFKIAEHVKNPTWVPPGWAGGGAPVGPGPANPLGDRWMGLNFRGYGIHSTNRPDSIGGAVSHGCIRTYPEMAHELFERVQVGLSVRIENRPVKLGYDEELSEVCLAVFPDIYAPTERLGEARRLLKQAGLTGLVEEERLRTIVANGTGVAEILGGMRMHLAAPSQVSEAAGLYLNERLYVDSAGLEAVGVVVSEQGENLHLTYQGADTTCKPLSLREHRLVPIQLAFQGLGLNYRWDAPSKTLYLNPLTPGP